MSERLIFHIDVNSAYLSWSAAEKLKQGSNLDLREIPSIIGGDMASRHGVVLAKSIPAKAFGITTGEPVAHALQKCPRLVLEPPNHKLYAQYSQRLMALLIDFCPLIEQVSIDECYMDFTEYRHRYSAPTAAAEQIKDTVKNTLGFTVNIGISSNKLLAKMASDFQKPDKVHTLLNRKEIEEKLWPLPVGELFMVGRASVRKLRKININTIGDLAHSDKALLRSLLKSHGQLIWEYANGIDHDRVVPNDQVLQKGLSNSMTLPYDVTDKEEAQHYILALTDRVTSRLRRHRCKASLIGISVKTNGFIRYSHQMQLSFFLDDTTGIYDYLCQLFSACWKGEPIRQIGIHLSAFVRKDEYQLSIYDLQRIVEDENLNTVVDQIRDRFGQTAIYRGTFVNTDMKPLEGGVNDGNYVMMGGYKL